MTNTAAITEHGTYTSVLYGNAAKTGRSPFVPSGQQYDGFIPAADVETKLFGWDPLIGTTESTVTYPAVITDEGVTPERTETLRDEKSVTIWNPVNGKRMKTFTDGWVLHPYRETLLGGLSNILGDTLGIVGAGLDHDGGRGWVAVSVPEVLSVEGYRYSPNLLAITSIDGSTATTFGRYMHAMICQNMLSTTLAGVRRSGEVVKVKHTRGSALKLESARQVLGIIEQTVDEFDREVRELVATTVTANDFTRFLDLHIPVTETPGGGRTQALRKQDEVRALYTADERCTPWTGNAFGVVQAMNTWLTHVSRVQGDRGERNTSRMLDGKLDQKDRSVVVNLGRALHRELLPA